MKRSRAKIKGTAKRPRLSIFISNKHIYLQVVNDIDQKTIVSISTIKDKKSIDSAIKMAKNFSKKLEELKIKSLVFDRRGKKFHGIVKAIAEELKTNNIKI